MYGVGFFANRGTVVYCTWSWGYGWVRYFVGRMEWNGVIDGGSGQRWIDGGGGDEVIFWCEVVVILVGVFEAGGGGEVRENRVVWGFGTRDVSFM